MKAFHGYGHDGSFDRAPIIRKCARAEEFDVLKPGQSHEAKPIGWAEKLRAMLGQSKVQRSAFAVVILLFKPLRNAAAIAEGSLHGFPKIILQLFYAGH
jgi:hypothetical protein